MGEKKWYESLWEFSSGGVNWVSKAYEGVKKAAVKAVASAINALPGNLCNPSCETGLMAGLNAGLVALGVPPSLPNMDELTNQGMNYLVQVAATQAGIDCDAACQDAIRSGIKQMARQVQAQTVASYCDATIAHNHGAEPICPPPGVTVKPAPGSSSRPARITVRVTRKPGATTYSCAFPRPPEDQLHRQELSRHTQIHGSDQHLLHRHLGLPVRFRDAARCRARSSRRCSTGISPELPRIPPGRSLEYTFFLTPADYWLPGHKARIAAKGGHVQYNDWWKLYQGASLTVSVDVDCPRTIGAPMASCVKQPATRHVAIPADGK